MDRRGARPKLGDVRARGPGLGLLEDDERRHGENDRRDGDEEWLPPEKRRDAGLGGTRDHAVDRKGCGKRGARAYDEEEHARAERQTPERHTQGRARGRSANWCARARVLRGGHRFDFGVSASAPRSNPGFFASTTFDRSWK